MRILFAAPDRDLLESMKKILEADLGETVTAFDGTQVLSLTAAEKFDVAVLDLALPRVRSETLIARMREISLPVIALTSAPLDLRMLTKGAIANDYLVYPFTPGELEKAISETADRAVSGTRMNAGGVEIDVSAFRIVNGEYLTAGQIDVLRAVQSGEPVDEKDKAYIGALNAALERSGAKARIKYETGKGFELVTNDE